MSTSHILKYTFAYAWFILAVGGLSLLMNYSNAKGTSAHIEKQWPGDSRIERDILPTLVMFVHPFCPCSMASMGELERLMPYIHDKVNVNVVFISLKNMQAADINEWKQTQLYKQAAKIPGVNIIRDSKDAEAKLFGAETSGHTVFYDQKGKLLFSGGITPARGHMGDSLGRTTILSWMENNHNNTMVEGAIFGCALRAPASK